MGVMDGSRTFVPGSDLEETVVCFRSNGVADDSRPASFWHPRIDPSFSSPLVNADNLAFSGDWWPERCAQRVAMRLKPIAFLSGERAEVERLADLVRDAGGHARVEPYSFSEAFSFAAAVDGLVGETFALDALYADYEGYLRGERSLLAPIAHELERLAPLHFSDLLDFAKVEVRFGDGLRRWPETLVRCGLLLGYPPQTTAALVLGDHGLPGGYTNY